MTAGAPEINEADIAILEEMFDHDSVFSVVASHTLDGEKIRHGARTRIAGYDEDGKYFHLSDDEVKAAKDSARRLARFAVLWEIKQKTGGAA